VSALRSPERDLAGVLVRSWRDPARLDRVALTEEAGEVTYGALAADVEGRAAALVGRGLVPGEIVGIVGEKTSATIASFLAAMLAGGCPVFLDPRDTDQEIVARLRRVGGERVVVGDEARVPALAALGSAHSLADLSGPGALGDLGALGGPAGPGDVAGPDDPAMMLFTSGSTGEPKGIVLTHANLLANARGVVERTQITDDDVLLHVMPLHHTNGVNNQVLAPLLAGARVVLRPRFSPADAVASLRRHRPTYMTGVPTMYLRMIDHLGPDERYDGLRFLRCGSAPITVAQQQLIEARFGVPLILSYGMSEATCTSTMNPVDRPRPGSVGTVLAEQTVRVVRPGTLQDATCGEEGEILIGGAAVMAGYLTDAGLVDPTDAGWLRTGDLGRLDEDGYLTVSGRLKDTIIRGGENITPATVERVLITHEQVHDCCVVAQPHPDLGEVPVAFVSTVRDAAVSDADLRAWSAGVLAPPSVPAAIYLLDDLPTTPLGKHDRTRLRAMAARCAEAEAVG